MVLLVARTIHTTCTNWTPKYYDIDQPAVTASDSAPKLAVCCLITLCTVCAKGQKTSIYTLSVQMSLRKEHILLTHSLYMLPEIYARPIESYMESATCIPHISSHMIVP